MKKWYSSKALWLSVLMIAGGVAEYIAGLPVGASISTIAAGIINIIIRFLTNTSIAGTPGAKPKK